MLLFIGMLGVIAVLLAEAHEWAEAHWVRLRRRLLVGPAAEGSDGRYRPKVSIHVPAYNEPPEMVIETLDALARLDYREFRSPRDRQQHAGRGVWRPVEAHCAALGRASASSISVRCRASRPARSISRSARPRPTREIVAVIDSDYVVEPNWLRGPCP